MEPTKVIVSQPLDKTSQDICLIRKRLARFELVRNGPRPYNALSGAHGTAASRFTEAYKAIRASC